MRAAGASLLLLGGREGMLPASKPVVAVTAVRTGCGKSQVRTCAVLCWVGLGWVELCSRDTW